MLQTLLGLSSSSLTSGSQTLIGQCEQFRLLIALLELSSLQQAPPGRIVCKISRRQTLRACFNPTHPIRARKPPRSPADFNIPLPHFQPTHMPYFQCRLQPQTRSLVDFPLYVLVTSSSPFITIYFPRPLLAPVPQCRVEGELRCLNVSGVLDRSGIVRN